MTQAASNLRVRRTKILLREALIELIGEQEFDAITVGQLTKRAMVSRAAFYRNFQDKYDLVEQIFEEAMSVLFEAIGKRGPQHPPDVWVRFFDHIAQYDRLYRALLGEKGSPWFARKMRARLVELVKERHGPLTSARAAYVAHPVRPAHQFSDTFMPDLVAAMIVEAITWWLGQAQPYPPKELATKTALLASAMFREARTWS
jgi:AcrR family transcriptional regulator